MTLKSMIEFLSMASFFALASRNSCRVSWLLSCREHHVTVRHLCRWRGADAALVGLSARSGCRQHPPKLHGTGGYILQHIDQPSPGPSPGHAPPSHKPESPTHPPFGRSASPAPAASARACPQRTLPHAPRQQRPGGPGSWPAGSGMGRDDRGGADEGTCTRVEQASGRRPYNMQAQSTSSARTPCVAHTARCISVYVGSQPTQLAARARRMLGMHAWLTHPTRRPTCASRVARARFSASSMPLASRSRSAAVGFMPVASNSALMARHTSPCLNLTYLRERGPGRQAQV